MDDFTEIKLTRVQSECKINEIAADIEKIKAQTAADIEKITAQKDADIERIEAQIRLNQSVIELNRSQSLVKRLFG